MSVVRCNLHGTRRRRICFVGFEVWRKVHTIRKRVASFEQRRMRWLRLGIPNSLFLRRRMPRPIKQVRAGMIDRGKINPNRRAGFALSFQHDGSQSRATCRRSGEQPQSLVAECEIRGALQVTGSRRCCDRRAAVRRSLRQAGRKPRCMPVACVRFGPARSALSQQQHPSQMTSGKRILRGF
jgi:hypothetical protein